MDPILRKRLILIGLWLGVLMAGIVLVMTLSIALPQSIPEDPPPKIDTTKIDIKQMKEKNLNAEQQIRLLDSLIMKIDTLKQKK